MKKNLYKIGIKEVNGFSFKSFWKKKQWQKAIESARKKGIFFEAWKVGGGFVIR